MKSWGQLFYRVNNNLQSFICYLRISKREVYYSRQIVDSNLYYNIVYLWAINNYEILKIHSSHKRINTIIAIKHLEILEGRHWVILWSCYTEERGCLSVFLCQALLCTNHYLRTHMNRSVEI